MAASCRYGCAKITDPKNILQHALHEPFNNRPPLCLMYTGGMLSATPLSCLPVAAVGTLPGGKSGPLLLLSLACCFIPRAAQGHRSSSRGAINSA
jgi:hypothetical protein